jgi:hypothetical protein
VAGLRTLDLAPPNYPIIFLTNQSQQFDCTAYGDASNMEHNGSDGQDEADGEDDDI